MPLFLDVDVNALLLLLLLVGELWLGPPLAADPFMLLFVRSIKSNLILM